MPFLRIHVAADDEAPGQTTHEPGLRLRFVLAPDPESGTRLDLSVWDTREHALASPPSQAEHVRVIEIEHIYVNEMSHAFGLGRALGVPLGREIVGRGPKYRDAAPA